MKRILFVDDNEVLLQLYEAMMLDESTQWEVKTAASGEKAMELIQEAPFDVVVSDMQMPGMTGIELLREVRKLHSRTSRIIIAGMTDQAAAADALSCTHLFFPKPFELRLIQETLARIISLDAYLKDDKLRELAGRMRTLPSFPKIYQQIIREIESPHSSLQTIADIVAKDPGITAKILQVANSAASGLPDHVHDPADAVQQLGLTTVRSLALSAQAFNSFKPGQIKDFCPHALWSHLMRCGHVARAIMLNENASLADAEDAFTAGMLHDLGRLMLADSLPMELDKAQRRAQEPGLTLPQAELEIFGATHSGLAAYLFGLWGLPATIVEAVAFHETPEKSDLKQFSALTAVHVANALLDNPNEPQLNLDYLNQIGVANRVDEWRSIAAELEQEQEPVS